jgi:hypothetical protein
MRFLSFFFAFFAAFFSFAVMAGTFLVSLLLFYPLLITFSPALSCISAPCIFGGQIARSRITLRNAKAAILLISEYRRSGWNTSFAGKWGQPRRDRPQRNCVHLYTHLSR